MFINEMTLTSSPRKCVWSVSVCASLCGSAWLRVTSWFQHRHYSWSSVCLSGRTQHILTQADRSRSVSRFRAKQDSSVSAKCSIKQFETRIWIIRWAHNNFDHERRRSDINNYLWHVYLPPFCRNFKLCCQRLVLLLCCQGSDVKSEAPLFSHNKIDPYF